MTSISRLLLAARSRRIEIYSSGVVESVEFNRKKQQLNQHIIFIIFSAIIFISSIFSRQWLSVFLLSVFLIDKFLFPGIVPPLVLMFLYGMVLILALIGWIRKKLRANDVGG